MRHAVTITILASAAWAAPAWAEDTYVVPDTPALSLLGGGTTDILQPTSVSSLAASVSSLVATSGELQPGVAVEVSPYNLGLGKEITAGDYEKNYRYQLLRGTSFSVATSSVDAEAGGIRLALGARVVLFDGSDPLLNRTYQDATQAAQDACTGATPPLVGAAFAECLDKAYTAAVSDGLKEDWNNGGAALGAAISASSADTLVTSLQGERLGGWASFAMKTEPGTLRGQLLLGLSGAQGIIPGSDENQLDVGINSKWRVGNEKSRFVTSASASLSSVGSDMDFSVPVAVGTELRLDKGNWLQLSIGADISSEETQLFVVSDLDWGFVEKPTNIKDL